MTSTSPVLRSRRIPDAARAVSRRRTFLVRTGYVGVGLTIFAAYLVSTFPYSVTLSKVLAPMGLAVSSAGQSASFPFGARLTDVRVTSMRPGGLRLESPDVTIAPAFLSMLTLHPGVRIKAALFEGIVNATIRPSSRGTAIGYDLASVDIARQPFFAIPGAQTAGRISGDGNLLLSPSNVAESGDGDLNAAGLTVASPMASGPINLGEGHSTFKLDQGTLTIEQFATSGGDLVLTGQGTIELAPDPDDSELEIEFTLSASPAAESRLSALLSMLPHPPGGEPYRLTGTLNSPRII